MYPQGFMESLYMTFNISFLCVFTVISSWFHGEIIYDINCCLIFEKFIFFYKVSRIIITNDKR